VCRWLSWESHWLDNSTPIGPKVTLGRLQVATLEPKRLDSTWQKNQPNFRLQVDFWQVESSQNEVPSYLLIKDYEPGISLRSSNRLLLRPPRAKLVCSRRAFSVNAPMVWNSLSFSRRSAQSISSCKRISKTDIFYLLWCTHRPCGLVIIIPRLWFTCDVGRVDNRIVLCCKKQAILRFHWFLY